MLFAGIIELYVQNNISCISNQYCCEDNIRIQCSMLPFRIIIYIGSNLRAFIIVGLSEMSHNAILQYIAVRYGIFIGEINHSTGCSLHTNPFRLRHFKHNYDFVGDK